MIRQRRGFLLLPFSWATKWLEIAAGQDASLLEDVFHLTPKGMHLLALALAHLEQHDSLKTAPLLFRGTAGDILDRVFGRRIPGLNGAIKRMPPRVLARESYRDLVKLLQDPSAAEVLKHANEIDDESLGAILAIPEMLHPFVITMAKHGFSVEGLGDALHCLVIRGASESYAALETKLRAITKPSQLMAAIKALVAKMPAPTRVLPAQIGPVRRIKTADEIWSLAKSWQNCLGMYAPAVRAGSHAIFLHEDPANPAVSLLQWRPDWGWMLEDTKGPRNYEIAPDMLRRIRQAFFENRIPTGYMIAAAEWLMVGTRGRLPRSVFLGIDFLR